MKITIKDIAKKANVSYATVSRALNGSREISAETKQKILEICKELNYSPNAIARGLVTSNTRTIGLIMPDITNPFFPEIALGVEEECVKKNYNVFLCNTNYDINREESYINLLIERRVEGIIISSASDKALNILTNSKSGIPVIFVGNNPRNDNCNFVATDNEKAGFLATEYLIKLGHRKIAFIGGYSESNSHFSRIKGFKAALLKHKILPDIEFIINSAFKRESGYRITKFLIRNNNLPTAIIAANDVVALGIIEACNEMSISIPNEISVIGFDDISFASLPNIMLTTMAQPKYELGKLSTKMLFEHILNKESSKNSHKILDPKLIIRNTCKNI